MIKSQDFFFLSVTLFFLPQVTPALRKSHNFDEALIPQRIGAHHVGLLSGRGTRVCFKPSLNVSFFSNYTNNYYPVS